MMRHRHRLYAVSGRTPAELNAAAAALATELEAGREPPAGADHGPCRRFVVSDTTAGAAARLRQDHGGGSPSDDYEPGRPIVFMLSGVGDQYSGMIADLYHSVPAFRKILDQCLDLLEAELATDLRESLFAATEDGHRGPDLASLFQQRTQLQGIHQTSVAQPLAFATQYAMAQTLVSLAITPQALLGYSLGDLVAGCLAGVFGLEDALHVTAERARLASAQPTGAMLAVASGPEPLLSHLGDDVCVAALNGPEHTVLAGPTRAIQAISSVLLAEEIACRMLATSHAFHSPLMDPVVDPLRAAFSRIALDRPKVPFLSNVTGTWIRDQEATDPNFWALHSRKPIRFADELTELWKLPSPIPIELGPGRTLSNLAMRHGAQQSGGRRLVLQTLPGALESRTGQETFLATVGRLWTTGVDVNLSALADGAAPRVGHGAVTSHEAATTEEES